LEWETKTWLLTGEGRKREGGKEEKREQKRKKWGKGYSKRRKRQAQCYRM
jgi:hypothetical protein